MDESYWDQMAESFESDVFDVFSNDRLQQIRTLIDRVASRRKVASDLGCGIGRLIPVLSESFRHVYGIDYSRRCLDRAKASWGHLRNVEFRKADLSAQRVRLPRVDFAVSVNAILMPSLSDRSPIFRAIGRHVGRGGHLLLVVPAFESALYANFRLTEWNLRCGQSFAPAQGIISISGVPTKHYLREELQVSLSNQGFRVVEIKKLPYSWKTEFARPPRWMKQPYPWDWLVFAEKETGR